MYRSRQRQAERGDEKEKGESEGYTKEGIDEKNNK